MSKEKIVSCHVCGGDYYIIIQVGTKRYLKCPLCETVIQEIVMKDV